MHIMFILCYIKNVFSLVFYFTFKLILHRRRTILRHYDNYIISGSYLLSFSVITKQFGMGTKTHQFNYVLFFVIPN